MVTEITENGTRDVARHTVPQPEPEADTSYGRFSRRNVLKLMIYAGWGAFALAGALPALAIKTLQQQKQAAAAGDKLVTASGANAGQPIKLDDLKPGTAVQAFPANKSDNQNNLIQLVRLPNGGANNGIVAYSAICTHLGCAVLGQLNVQGNIQCPCHGSIYNPADGAKVVGGPAPRPLPSLPVQVGPDGTLAASGVFSGPIGVQ